MNSARVQKSVSNADFMAFSTFQILRRKITNIVSKNSFIDFRFFDT